MQLLTHTHSLSSYTSLEFTCFDLTFVLQDYNIRRLIDCRLDYCNSVLYGVSGNLMRKVQSFQNAAVRLVTEHRHRDHITPVL